MQAPLDHDWPDAVDQLALVLCASLAIGLPVAGYVLMVLDYRTYLRSLRRSLVAMRRYAVGTPAWLASTRPPCVVALGLSIPFTRDEVFAAYRKQVKSAHPDAGGDRRDFERLQQHLADALRIVDASG